MRVVAVCLLLVAGAPGAAAQDALALRAERERELAMVQHLRRHLEDPGDGLALNADRRDLQRLCGGTATPGARPSLSMAPDEVELLDALSPLADVWCARPTDRTPFALMPRDRLAGLTVAQEAIGRLQSLGAREGTERFLPEMREELDALARLAAGQGAPSDETIELALRLADAASVGRPGIGPGPYSGGVVMPGSGPSGSGPPPGAGAPPSPGYGPPQGRSGPTAPYPSGNGPTPYTLPPGYEGYAPGAATASGGVSACQAVRTAAGASGEVSDMVRAAECWSRTPTWPGWGAQVLEALDWATTLARIDRDCTALAAALDALREYGPRVSVAGLSSQATRLAERAESDRRHLRSRDVCRQ